MPQPARAFWRAGAFYLSMYRPLPSQTAGAHSPELPGHSQAKVIVVVQIGLFLLTLEALALLKLFPGCTAFVTTILVVGAGALTGQHKNDSSQLMFPPGFRLPQSKKTAAEPELDTGTGVQPGICRRDEGGGGGGRRRALNSYTRCSGAGLPSYIPPSSEGKLAIL